MHHRESQTFGAAGHCHRAMAKVLKDECGDPACVLVGIHDQNSQN
jgi:hypothetical protein